MHTLWQDSRFAVRMLKKNSGFTAVAVLTLVMAIGANAVVFSVLNENNHKFQLITTVDGRVCCELFEARLERVTEKDG